jgi:flagellar hook-associated protein 2
VMNSLGNYSGTSGGSVNSLADLGLSFDLNGHLDFDSSTFDAATSGSLTAALSFLGSESGGGYLQAANTALTAVTDPTTGIITQQTQSIGASLNTLTTTISNDQTALATFQTNLTNQMAQADAAIAAIEQQASQITSLFSAQQTISKSISNG